MSEILYCRRCGAKRMNQAGGPCPRCLLGLAMQPEPSQDSPATGEAGLGDVAPTIASPPRWHGDLELPTASDLAAYFPQLEILELLGRGGMGAVYKARQRGLDRLVAVKILPPSAGNAPGFADRFTREARALARLNHPGIVAVYDFGHARGLYYFVMEYVDGSDLRRLISSGAVTPEEALAIIPQICDALQYAHDAGVIHRDIKPENILLDRRGQVKIADFGLAKLFGLAAPDYTLTAAECSMGTPRYMAPEQMDNPKSVDHRADIYSLGVVFYEMLTGEVPAGRFAVPSQKSKSDARLDPVVLRSLEQEPDRRYQKVSDVKTAVATACSTPPGPQTMPPPLPPALPPSRPTAMRRRMWKRAIIGAAIVVALMTITTIIMNSPSGSSDNEAGADASTPLIRAVARGNSEEVRQLLANGADINARDAAGDTALTKAASLGLLGPAQAFLNYHREPDGRSAAGATPLALAASNGHRDLVELLVAYGAQVNARGNAKGQTALLLAAANGHLSVVDYLLAPGEADLNLRDDDDLTPLVYAEARGWPEIAKRLRSRGATEDPDCRLTEAYMNALDGKPAEAIPEIEKLLALDIREFQRPWHILAKEWIYTVPRPRIFLSLVLAECYKRSGEITKTKAILASNQASFGTDEVVLYRRDAHPDEKTTVRETYSLGPADLKTWSTAWSTEPRVAEAIRTITPSGERNGGDWILGIVH